MLKSATKIIFIFAVAFALQTAANAIQQIDYKLVHSDNSLIDTYKVLYLGAKSIAHHCVRVHGIEPDRSYELTQLITDTSGELVSKSNTITSSLEPIVFLSLHLNDSFGVIYKSSLGELKMKLFDLNGNFMRSVSFNIPYVQEPDKLENAVHAISNNNDKTIEIIFLKHSSHEKSLLHAKYDLNGNIIHTDTLSLGSSEIFNLTTIQNSQGQNVIFWITKEKNSSSTFSIYVYNANSSLHDTKPIQEPMYYSPNIFLDLIYLPNGGLIILTADEYPHGYVKALAFYDGYFSHSSTTEMHRANRGDICRIYILNSDETGVICSAPDHFASEIVIYSASRSEVTSEKLDPNFGLFSSQKNNGFLLPFENDDEMLLTYSFIGDIRFSKVKCCDFQISSPILPENVQIIRSENRNNSLLKELELSVSENLLTQIVNVYLVDTANVYAALIPTNSWVESDDLCGFIKRRSTEFSESGSRQLSPILYSYEESLSGYPGFITFDNLRPNTSYFLTVCAVKNARESTTEQLSLQFDTQYTGYRFERVKLGISEAILGKNIQNWLCSLQQRLGLSLNDTSISYEGHYCQGQALDTPANFTINQTVTILVQGNSNSTADNSSDLVLHKIFQASQLSKNFSFQAPSSKASNISAYEYLGAIKDNIPNLLPLGVKYNSNNKSYDYELVVYGNSGYLYGIMTEESCFNDEDVYSIDLVTGYLHPGSSRLAGKRPMRIRYTDGEKIAISLPAPKSRSQSCFFYTVTNDNPTIFAAKTPIQYVVLNPQTNAATSNGSKRSSGTSYLTILFIIGILLCFVLMFWAARRFMDNDGDKIGDSEEYNDQLDEQITFEQTNSKDIESLTGEHKRGHKNLKSKQDTKNEKSRETQDLELDDSFTSSRGLKMDSRKVYSEHQDDEEEKDSEVDSTEISGAPRSRREKLGYQAFELKQND